MQKDIAQRRESETSEKYMNFRGNSKTFHQGYALT